MIVLRPSPIQRGLPWSHSQLIDSPVAPQFVWAQLRDSEFGRLLPADQQPAPVTVTASTARPDQYRLTVSLERTLNVPARLWLELFIGGTLWAAGAVPFTRTKSIVYGNT